MNVTPIDRLTPDQIRDLAISAADRGERIEDANPYPAGTDNRLSFASAFKLRARDLQRAAG